MRTTPDAASIETGTFDYIIVGGGSAGCVVAARLSESGRHRVLLLEAGGEDRSPWIHIPMGYAKTFANPKLNWLDESEPEHELLGRRLYAPHGRVLGGSSSINGMLYVRGHAGDYDGWRQRGCVGWDWNSVLPFFLKSEDQERGANAVHGVGGPQHVSDHPFRQKLADLWMTAAQEAGIERRDDYNDGGQEGVSLLQNTSYRRRRWSTARGFLAPARSRPNLVVVTQAQVTRILVEGGKAVGVEYLRRGKASVARTAGEIIVSAGVFNSPHILQVSGIGPGVALAQAGIPVIHDAPGVGSNLQDHFCVRIQFRCMQPITMNDLANSPFRQFLAGLQYIAFRTGGLSSNGVATSAFVRSDATRERPDLQLVLHAWSFEGRNKAGVKVHGFSGFSINASHLCPDARGDVRPAGPDPLASPEIRFNFLRTRHDIDTMISAVRIVRKISVQPTLKPYVAEELNPGPTLQSDAELERSVRERGGSNMHAAGSCHMGVDPGEAAVDPRLRLHGLGGLRVIDASVMPTITAGGTNAPTIMIAEKGSAMVLEDAR